MLPPTCYVRGATTALRAAAPLVEAAVDLAATAAELTKLEAGLAGLGVRDGGGYGVAVGSRAHLQEDAVAKRKW